MQVLQKFLSLDDCFKDLVKKRVPEFADRDDFEVDFKKDIVCPTCGSVGRNNTGALFYRVTGTTNWIPVESSNCSSCRDKEAFGLYQNRSLLEQKEQIGSRLIKEYYFVPDELKTAGFKNYENTNDITKRAKKITWEYAKNFVENPTERHNLLIMGTPGSGKTHLCAAVARYIKENGFIVGFLTTGKLLSKIKSTYKNGSNKSEDEILQDLKKMDLLVIDDVGSEAIGGNDDWRKSMIFEIIDSRSEKPTIYTSNLTDVDLPVAVGDRVFSRLYKNTKFLDMFIENYDYRKKLVVK